MGQPLGVHRLLPDGGVRRTAAHGEVVALEGHTPAGDSPLAHHGVGGQEAGQVPIRVVVGAAGQRARLVKAAAIEEALDALADGEASRGMLARDPLVAAHLPGERLAAPQLLELGLPAH